MCDGNFGKDRPKYPGAPDEMAGDEQHDGVPDSALAMFKTVLSQSEHCI
jgi:hypothetical protein